MKEREVQEREVEVLVGSGVPRLSGGLHKPSNHACQLYAAAIQA